MRLSRKFLLPILITLLSIISTGCSDTPDPGIVVDNKETIDKTVVVVLPMENGLQSHWQNIFTLLEHNTQLAFSSQQKCVRLNIEYHDESTENLEDLARSLSIREDVYAVIGGLYSSSSRSLASILCRNGITFFTLGTTEELVRAFSSTGNLWAMTETDITQMEVLLSKVVNYGGESVALIADESSLYGKTFIDWFAFQAKELGLTVTGIHNYSGKSISQAASEAASGHSDYVICVPNRVEDITPVIREFNSSATPAPRLLFSDMGYGSDVLESLGNDADGIEGVCFGADPESGFDISYNTFFDMAPTVGAAQLYDAAMLTVYAAWYQHLHPEVTLRDALRDIVDGRDFNMGSWMGEDMRNVITALTKGDYPYVRGASGPLDFDSKVYTNVLSTVYYNYKVYDGHYIILDYNTANGGNRTDATLAGWNWKATQMQDFSSGSLDINYDPLTSHKALIVATSTGWTNYRHQADALAMYSLLKSHGYTDDDIILILADDIADNSRNPDIGEIRVTPGGTNLYTDVHIDYNLKDLQPDDIRNILAGEATDRTPLVIDGDSGTNILVFWSGHGTPGALCWNNIEYGVKGDDMKYAMQQLYIHRRYRKLAMFVETCYSGGVMQDATGFPGMIFYTAANPDETSKADVFNSNLGVWMSNRFTSTLLENLTKTSTISMRNLYNRLFINTVGSHVMVYNDSNYGNLYNASMDEFINP